MEARFSSQSAGYLLGRIGLLVMLAVMLLAAWSGQLVIVILLALMLAAAGVAKLWSRFSLSSVQYQRILSQNRAFPGEDIELKLRVVNGKLLPLPWIQLDDAIPLGLGSPDVPLVPGEQPGSGLLSKGASLLWYSGVSWKHRLHCGRRGYYRLGPLAVSSGDIFGFYPRSEAQPSPEPVIVYPRIYPVSRLGIPSLYPLGETTAERRIFEDPSRTIGVRDYTPHDSLRHVHWKATARHQSLQVKVFEPTTTLKVALFIAVDSFRQDDSIAEEDFELGISTAASVANHIIGQGNQAGLFVNTAAADSGQPVSIMPGSGAAHLVSLLEALARVTGEVSGAFEDFFQSQQRNMPWGTTLAFILSGASEEMRGLLAALGEQGQRLLVVPVGDSAGEDLAGAVAWHSVRRPEEFLRMDGTG
jgi:uncharacterized protein (DUF58 family)